MYITSSCTRGFPGVRRLPICMKPALVPWGRFRRRELKETWALIAPLLYIIAMHSKSTSSQGLNPYV